MAEYISFQPTDHFNPKLWMGNGSTQAITGVGFQPDLVWIKSRTSTQWHQWVDAVRGTTKYLYSNASQGEATATDRVTSFDSDGFTLDSANHVNQNNEYYVNFNWKAGTTSGITTNGSTTITPNSYSFNQTSGFSIIDYPSNATSGAGFPHGLGKAPTFVIIKRKNESEQWQIYSEALGNTKYMRFTTQGPGEDAGWWNNTSPDATNMILGNNSAVNNGGDYMAYCFTDIKGYQKCNSYIGNGNSDGPFVYTGFRPAFIMVKKTAASIQWTVWNDKVTDYSVDPNYGGVNIVRDAVFPSSDGEEAGDYSIDITSNGWKIKDSGGNLNSSGSEYIYVAVAKFPIVSSNDVPGVAR